MSVYLYFDVCLWLGVCLCLDVCLSVYVSVLFSFRTGAALSEVLVFKSDILLHIADCTVGRYAGIQPRDSVGSHQEFAR